MFSIIMPVWNRASIVGKAIESVLAQTFKDYELLIVDDGSEDDLANAVGPYLSERVRYLRRPHLGAAAARNQGLIQSTQPFIAYLDSDNQWYPEFLAVMAGTIRANDSFPEAIHCLARRLRRDPRSGRIYQDGLIGGKFDVTDILDYPRIDLNSFVHARKVLDDAGFFDEKLKRLIDWDFILRIFSRVKPVFINRVLLDYYSSVHNPTITGNEDVSQSYEQVRCKHEPLRRSVRLVHDTIVYTWDVLPPEKQANWIRAQQQKPQNDEGFSRVCPVILQIEPTNRCNLSCANCPRAERDLRRPFRDMTFEEFRFVIDDLEDSLMLLILWDWGEPLLNRDLPRMVRYATRKDIRTVTSTNGQLLSDEPYIRTLLEAGLSTLIIAVDSVEQDSYARFRKGGRLDHTISGIERVVGMKKALGAKTIINMRTVVSRYNEDRIEELRTLALQLGADHFSVKTLNPTVDTEFKDDELAPLNKVYRRYAYEEGSWTRVRKAHAPCFCTSMTATVQSNGNLVPCTYDFDGSLKIGNAFAQPVSRLWNSLEFRKLRQSINHERKSLARCNCCNINFELASGSWFVTPAQSAAAIEAPRLHPGGDSPAERMLLPAAPEEYLLRQNHQMRDETLQVLLTSRFWRMTQPLRRAMDAFQTVRWLIRGRHGDPPATATMRLLPPPQDARQKIRSTVNEILDTSHQARLQRDLDHFLNGPGQLILNNNQTPVISVLLVLHNRAALTFACLTALKKGMDIPFELIVVDDGSTDETPALLARLSGVRVLKNSQPAGFVHACNQAASVARGAYLLMLGQETMLQLATMTSALHFLTDLPDVGAVGGPCLAPDGQVVISQCFVYDTGRIAWDSAPSKPDRTTKREMSSADFATRLFLITPRDLWGKVGGLDDYFDNGLYTEVDYCFKLRHAGKKIIFDPTAAATINAMPSALTQKHIADERHQAIFQARHLELLVTQKPDPKGDRGYTMIDAGYSSSRRDANRPHIELYWHFNEACNFRCSYCFRAVADYFRGQEHPACGRFEPEEIAARFNQSGFAWKIVFTGGEPLLAPHFVDVCRALSLRHRIALNTNLSNDQAYAFADAVNPSRVHDIYAALHPDERDRVEGGWTGFLERFRYFLKKGFTIRAVYVTHPSYFDRMERDLERLREQGIEDISLKVFRGIWKGCSYPADYTPRQRQLMERIGLTPLEQWVLKNDFRLQSSICGSGYRGLHMDPFGNLTRCNTVNTGYGNLLLGKYRLDDFPSPCPAEICGCPYQGFKYAGSGAFGE
ncbi:MAG TPA: glycosyltransferase [Smithella sp.]|nr:glycosyltransferase [Smithella sp.]